MAFFKAKVLRQRKDGMYVVYIRVTQNRKSQYIRTSWIVDDMGLSKDKQDVIDPFVAEQTSKVIARYYNILNRIDTQNWTVKEIVDYIQKGKDGISFSMYARKHIEKMKARGQERTSRDYKWALYSLEKYAGNNEVMFSQLTYSFLSRWIDSLSQTARSKNKYPINIRQIHKAAMLEYNDEERGIQLITNPWPKITIPKEDTPNKRAISPNMLRRFFAVVPDFSRFTHPLQELGQDVALISFCMCGINSIDLFFAKKSQYHNGVFHYNRRKTSKSRSDNAYFEIMVPQFIKPTFEKYLSKNIESPWLFDFQDRLSTSDSFNANVNAGITIILLVMIVGLMISLLSFYILILSIFLLVQKNSEKLENLLLIGYTPMQVSRPYQLLTIGLNVIVFGVAVVVMLFVRKYYLDIIEVLFPQMDSGSILPSLVIGALLFLFVSCLNIVIIWRRIRSIL